MTTALIQSAHGDLDCATVEAILTDSANEAAELREENEQLHAVDAARQAEMDALRGEVNRSRALISELSKKLGKVSEERSALDEQISLVFAELTATEADAVPADTYAFAVLPQSETLAAYRKAARVRTGPLPREVQDELAAAKESVSEAMLEAGRVVAEAVVRRAVRRRNARARRTAGRGA